MKNKRLSFQVYFAITFAVLVTGLFLYINNYTNELLESNVSVINDISTLKELDYKLNQEIIRSSSTLYHNYDGIHIYLNQIYKLLDNINNNKTLEEQNYSQTEKSLAHYEALIKKKDEYIQKFLTINSVIKNSSLYIPTMLLRYVKEYKAKGSYQYLLEIAKITSSIFLAKNTLDSDFIANYLAEHQGYLEKLQNSKEKEFNQVFKSHVKVFLIYFKSYVFYYKNILNSGTIDHLNKLQLTFIDESNKRKARIQFIYIIVLTIFILAIVMIIYLLYVSDKAIYKMNLFQTELEKQSRTDFLTQMSNRHAFNDDVRRCKNPILFFIGINNFGRINEFYGNKLGDRILLEVSFILSELEIITKSEGSIYSFESSKFGVLFNEEKLTQSVHETAVDIIYAIESHKYKYRSSEIFIEIDIGIANEPPLLEKAQMVLNHLKHDMHMKCLFYKNDLLLEEEIERKFTMTELIRRCINESRVIPFFQPIINNETNKIEKFECLVRILDDDNNIINPDKFLSIAIESHLYNKITMQMVEKCINYFSESNYDFTINLSMLDIEDPLTRSFIFKQLDKFPDVVHRLTFEIVESEKFENYALLQQFSNQIRGYGAKLAIDDFGSGYSNFSQILGLNADYLKIDATLIKNIDKEIESEILVKAIVDFSKKLKIKKVIAEHVDRLEVLDKIKELGIGYSQGFYFGKPKRDI